MVIGVEHWILDDNHQIVPASLMEWAVWFEHTERHVAQSYVGELHVSTVFLGIDHNFHRHFDPHADQRPVLFETMIMGMEEHTYQERCCTWEEAQEMHAIACKFAGHWVEQAYKTTRDLAERVAKAAVAAVDDAAVTGERVQVVGFGSTDDT